MATAWQLSSVLSIRRGDLGFEPVECRDDDVEDRSARQLCVLDGGLELEFGDGDVHSGCVVEPLPELLS